MGIVNKIMEIMMRSRMNVIEESIKNPIGTQERVLFENIKKAKSTIYGKEFHFEEINRLRAGIGRDPLPEDMLVWSSCCLRNQGYTVLSYAVNLSTAMVHTLIGECVQLDDCGTANTVCVFGEPHDKRTNV